MNTENTLIPAPVPHAEQPDLAKMVQAAAKEAIDTYLNGYHGSDMNEDDLSAILLRHLQPLAEQVGDLQRWKNEQLVVESCWDVQAVGKLLGLPLGIDIRANIESCIVGLQSQLTAAQEELAAERNLHGQTRVVVEELNTICNDLRNAGQPQFIRSEAIRLLREEVAALRGQLTALQSALAQKEKDGERHRWLMDRIAQETLVLELSNGDEVILSRNPDGYDAAIDRHLDAARSESTPAAKE